MKTTKKRAVLQVHKSAGGSTILVQADPVDMADVVDEALHVYDQLPDHTMIGDEAGMRVFPGINMMEIRPDPDEDD